MMGLLEPTEIIDFDEEKYQKNILENEFAEVEDGKGENK